MALEWVEYVANGAGATYFTGEWYVNSVLQGSVAYNTSDGFLVFANIGTATTPRLELTVAAGTDLVNREVFGYRVTCVVGPPGDSDPSLSILGDSNTLFIGTNIEENDSLEGEIITVEHQISLTGPYYFSGADGAILQITSVEFLVEATVSSFWARFKASREVQL